jgi:hypothetical protein
MKEEQRRYFLTYLQQISTESGLICAKYYKIIKEEM